MTDVSTDVALLGSMNALEQSLGALKSGGSLVWVGKPAGNFDEQLALTDAIGDSEPLAQNIGTVINLVNVVVQPIEMDDQNGNPQAVPRIVLIDDQGKGYHVISLPTLKQLEQFVGLFGPIDKWTRPLPVVAVQGRAARGNFITLKTAGSAAKGK